MKTGNQITEQLKEIHEQLRKLLAELPTSEKAHSDEQLSLQEYAFIRVSECTILVDSSISRIQTCPYKSDEQ